MKKTLVFLTLASGIPLANATTFTSIATQDWSNPAAWNVGVGFPNTYAGDSAVIDAGTSVSYDGAIPTLGGNLAVSNGNAITINGGMLTQTWVPGAPPPFGTTIAIGLSSAASGTGTLTINSGGTFSSGTANGVVVGATTTALGPANGNGTINLNDGSMILDAASSAVGGTGLSIGINAGAVGVVNVGDATGAADSALLNLATNNALLTVGGTQGAGLGAGTGTLTVRTDGRLTFGTGLVNVGEGGGIGTLNLNGGSIVGGTGAMSFGRSGGAGTLNVTAGTLTSSGELVVGRDAGSTGNATLNGGNTSVGVIRVGHDSGSGTLTINGGALNSSDFVRIGGNNGNGNLALSSGSLNSTNYLAIGSDGGVGIVNQTGGTVSFGQWGVIGLGGGANTSEWNISGGNITSAAGLEVGADRTGTMRISGTANVAVSSFALGVRALGVGVVDMTGGTLNTTNLGIAGAQEGGALGTFNQSAGTININPGGGQSYIGHRTGSVGTLNVSGTGVVNNIANADWQIGFNGGTGNLNLSAGGIVNTNWWLNVARGAGSAGNITVDGAGTALTVGPSGDAQTNIGEDGIGTMSITNGGSFTAPGEVSVGRNAGSNGTLTVSGAGSSMNLTNHLFVGRFGTGVFTQNGGTLNLNGRRLQIADNGGSMGTVNLNGGTVANSEWIHVGSGVGATGNLNINYAAGTDTLTTGALYVGNGGATGAVTVNNGTLNATGTLEVGRIASGNGTLNISGAGSTVNAFAGGNPDGFVRIGTNSGQGVVNVTGGGKLSTGASWLSLGDAEGGGQGSSGQVTVDGAGSTVTSKGLIVGWFGQSTGSLNISNGAVVNNSGREVSIGRDLNGVLATSPVGTVSISSGGILNAGDSIRIGHGATGTLNVDGGTANFQSGWARIGEGGSSKGTVNLSAGTINSSDWTVVGNETGATGQLNVTGGTYNVNGAGDLGRLIVGRFGNGVVDQSGGAVNVGNWLAIGIDPGSSGVYNFTGGTLDTRSNIDIAQNNSTGIMNISHGNAAGTTITGNGGGILSAFNVGSDSGTLGAAGTLNMDLQDAGHKIVSTNLYAGNGLGTVGTINVTRGILQTNNEIQIGRNRGTGVLNVNGAEAVWNRGTSPGGGPSDMQIGFRGGIGQVNVLDGGTVNHNWWVNLGRSDGQGATSGKLVVDGAGSTFNIFPANGNNSQVNIGEQTGATGVLEVTNGGVFNHHNTTGVGGGEIHVSRDGGTTGTLLVSGAGSQFNTHAREFRVGTNGQGTLNITDGGVLNFTSIRENGVNADGNFGIGENAGVGTINMNNGTLNVGAWALFSAWNQTGSTATLNMVDSTLNLLPHSYIDGAGNAGSGGHLFWGATGQALINQEGGAINAAGWSAIGMERGGDAIYNLGVGGGGGSFTVNDSFYVGRQSHGTINMGLGTTLNVTAGEFNLGQETSPTTPSRGVINNDGGTVTANATVNIGRNGANGVTGIYTQTAGQLIVNSLGNDSTFIGRDGTTGTVSILGGTASFAGSINIGMGGGGSTGIVNVENATVTVNGWIAMGRDTGGAITNSTLNVGAGGILNHPQNIGGSELLLGWQNGSRAQVNVTDGGQVNYGWWTRVGVDAGSTGDLNVSGAGSRFSMTQGRTYIGESGIGNANVSDGGKFEHASTDIFVVGGNDAQNSSGVGSVTVSDAGSVFSSSGHIAFGRGQNAGTRASGTLTVNGGTVSATDWIAFGNNGGQGTLNMNGGLLSTGGQLVVGNDVAGSIGVANMTGGTVNVGSQLYIGRNAGNGTFSKTGGVVNVTAALEVGRNATGVLTNDGGNFNVNGVYVGNGAGSNGTINITNGTLSNSGWVDIGGGGTGTVNVDGPDAKFLGSISDMQIGTGAGGSGSVNVLNGGQMTHNWWINVGRGGGSTGAVVVDGAGSKLTQGTRVDSEDSRLNVGADPNDVNNVQSGTLTISNGGWVEKTSLGGEINVGRNVGANGTLTIESGGRLTSAGGVAFIGVNGGTGLMDISGVGSQFTIAGEIHVGINGGSIGTLNQDGGTLTASNMRVATNSSSGTYNFVNGIASISGDMTIGWQGAAVGTMTIAGGSVTANNDSYVGVDGTARGTLNMEGGTLTTGHLIVARDAGNTGTVQLNAGVLATNFITNAAGTAQVNFNGGVVKARSDRANFFEGFTPANSEIEVGGLEFDTNGFTVSATNILDGAGGLKKVGAGTLVLAGNNTFLGESTIQNGTLEINGKVGAGGVVTNAGTILSGIGTIEGDVTSNGGKLSPGAAGGVGTLTVNGSITLDSSSIFELTINDEAIGQFDRVVNIGAFDSGTASLMVTFNDSTFTSGTSAADLALATRYQIITGPTALTPWGNATLIPGADLAALGLSGSQYEILSGGQRFWLESGSLSLVPIAPIPEPTVALFIGSLVFLNLRRRRNS